MDHHHATRQMHTSRYDFQNDRFPSQFEIYADLESADDASQGFISIAATLCSGADSREHFLAARDRSNAPFLGQVVSEYLRLPDRRIPLPGKGCCREFYGSNFPPALCSSQPPLKTKRRSIGLPMSAVAHGSRRCHTNG